MRRLIAILPLLALTACGQARTASGSPLDTTLTWLPSELCDRQERCAGENARLWGNEACEDWMERRLRNVTHARYDEGIRRGTLTVNPGSESACRALLEGTCEWEASGSPGGLGGLAGLGGLGVLGCSEVVTGQVALGGDCVMDEECAGAGFCQQVTCTGGCRGVCVAPIPEGGANCRRDGDCASGLACIFGTPSTCVSLPPLGFACAPGEGRRCALGARCEGGMCVDISETPGALGGQCGSGLAPCGTGLYCQDACVAELRAGGACVNGLGGSGGRGCAEGLWCAPAGQCAAALSEGAACIPTSGGSGPACSAPLVCGQGNRCITPRNNGEPCASTIECTSLNCAAARCAPPPYQSAG